MSNSVENNLLGHVVPEPKLHVENENSKHNRFVAFARKPSPPNTSGTHFPLMRLRDAGLAVALSTILRYVARVFPSCFGAGEGESDSWPPSDCSCRIL